MNKPFQFISHLFNSGFSLAFFLFLEKISELEWPNYQKKRSNPIFLFFRHVYVIFVFLNSEVELAISVAVLTSSH